MGLGVGGWCGEKDEVGWRCDGDFVEVRVIEAEGFARSQRAFGEFDKDAVN